MSIAMRRVGYPAIITALVAGIIVAVALMWLPRFSGNPPARPEPPPLVWEVAQDLTLTTSSADFAVHDIIASPSHLTVMYSMKISSGDYVGQEALAGSGVTLVGSNGAIHRATERQRLGHVEGTTFGAATFEAYKLGSSGLTMRIPDMSVGTPGDSRTVTFSVPLEMQILTREQPQQPSGAIFRLPGARNASIGAGPYGSFIGSAPQGQVATVSYKIGGVDRFFLVKLDGHVQEISRQQISAIKSYLGITAQD